MTRTLQTTRRAALATIATAVLLATAPASALAVPPEVDHLTIDDAFVDTDLCGFPIDVVAQGTVTIRSFYDKQGELVKGIARVSLSFTGSTDSGVVHQRTHANEHWDFTGDGPPTLRITGLLGHVTAAGRVLSIEAGQSVEVPPGNRVSFSGNELAEEDVAARCEALSQ